MCCVIAEEHWAWGRYCFYSKQKHLVLCPTVVVSSCLKHVNTSLRHELVKAGPWHTENVCSHSEPTVESLQQLTLQQFSARLECSWLLATLITLAKRLLRSIPNPLNWSHIATKLRLPKWTLSSRIKSVCSIDLSHVSQHLELSQMSIPRRTSRFFY